MKKKILFATVALAVMAIACLSFAMTDGKRPKLNNTKWEHKTEMFVADAGTQTIKMTFEFTTKKDVTFTFHSYLPAHPAMYRNNDGTVDVIPARESSYSKKGTYKVKGSKIKVTWEDESTEELLFTANVIVQRGKEFAKVSE